MERDKRNVLRKKAQEAAKKTKYALRIREEIKQSCEELGIPFDSAHRKFYIRARNRGYNNGYSCAVRRNGNQS